MEVIENQRFGEERALYNMSNLRLVGCSFAGKEDGESALKECKNIVAEKCFMDLRYPFWHVKDLTVKDCKLTENCRAAMWYDRGVDIFGTTLNGIKALRECRNIKINASTAVSPEFCWKCSNINIKNSDITSEYAFLESEEIKAYSINFEGKYSFQYVKDVYIANSRLKTKDAFWHAENVTVTDSVLNGEYLGWYSDNLTLIRCKIIGTQPLCYCKNLKLTDCTMEKCDLSFEYSDVNATVTGEILSVKNPMSGKITADGIGEIIRTKNSVYPSVAEIEIRGTSPCRN